MAGVQVFPSELKFNFELRKELTTTLTLSNAGPQRLAFKVLTTNPDKYCVKPCMGLIEPRSSLEAVVAMQAYSEVPHDLHSCEDKFLVQSAVAPPDVKEVTERNFPSPGNGSISETRLPVLLELPDEDNPLLLNLALQTLGSSPDDMEDLSDDDEDDDDVEGEGEARLEESSQEVRQFFTANAEFASVAKDVLMDHLDKIMKERDELKRQVVILSPRGGPAQSEARELGPRPEGRKMGMGLPVVLAVAGSFLLGRWTA